MNRKRTSLLLIPLCFCLLSYGQDSSKRKITISGYAELYWGNDFNSPSSKTRPFFQYSHTRQRNPSLNLAFLKATYQSPRFRSAAALAAGTYMKANYANEPGFLKHLLEASAGIRLFKNKELWLDAGVFPSHIGFESAVSKDCRTLTRSLMAENSPYFETGLKLSYITANQKWSFTALALNGWQRIRWPENNKRIQAGLQVQFKPSSSVLLNYSNFIGSLYPPSEKRRRIFHNIYGQFSLSEQWALTAGLDLGTEDSSATIKGAATWFSPAVLITYSPSRKWSFTARGEGYTDKKGVVIPTGTSNGFTTWGYSVNADYSLNRFLLLRAEFRNLISRDAIFTAPPTASKRFPFVTVSLAAFF